MSSPESVAFRECYGALYDGIQSPVTLVPHLYSARVLTVEKRDELMNHDKPIAPMLEAVEQQIKTKPQVFHDFVKLLANEGVMQELCDLLDKACHSES